MKNAIIFIIALAVSNLALAESPAQIYGKYAAPFGLEWGLSKEQVTAMGVKLTPNESVKGAYTAKNLPKKLSDGEDYGLLFMQGLGLVKVFALTSDITGDLYGSKGKERYSQLKTAIANKYGKPDREIEWTDRDIDSDQFYQCLAHDGCGDWLSHWRGTENETDGGILLHIRGVSRGTGFIHLGYESAAYQTALKQKEAEKSRSDQDAL